MAITRDLVPRKSEEPQIDHMRLIYTAGQAGGFRESILKPILLLYPHYRVKVYVLDVSPGGELVECIKNTPMPEEVRANIEVKHVVGGDDATQEGFWQLAADCDPGSTPNGVVTELHPRDYRQTVAACRVTASRGVAGGNRKRAARDWPFETLPAEVALEDLRARLTSHQFPRRLSALLLAPRGPREQLLSQLSLMPFAWLSFAQLAEGAQSLDELWPWKESPDLLCCPADSFEEFCEQRWLPQAVCLVLTDDPQSTARSLAVQGREDIARRGKYPAVVLTWSPHAAKSAVPAWVTKPLKRDMHALPEKTYYRPRPQLETQVHEIRKTAQPKVIGFIGAGGVGKTTLLRHFLWEWALTGEVHRSAEKARDLPPLDALFAWDFYSMQSPGAFLRSFADYLSPGRRQAADSAEYLRLIREGLRERHLRRVLLVLDGLDVIQRPREDAAGEGELQSPEVLRLLEEIASAELPLTAIISTRLELAEFKHRRDGGYVPVRVNSLMFEEACRILRDCGVAGDDTRLGELAARFNNHPLTIYHLGRLLGDFHEGNPDAIEALLAIERASPKPDFGDASEFNLRLVHACYEKHLGGDELDVLKRVATVEVPLSVADFALIFSGADDARLAGGLTGATPERLQSRFDALRERQLLDVYERPGEPPRYAIHPALSQYFASAYMADAESHSRPPRRAAGARPAGGAVLGDVRIRAGEVRTRGAALGPRGAQAGRPTNPKVLDLLEKILQQTVRAGRIEEARVFYQRRMGGDEHLEGIGQRARALRVNTLLDDAATSPEVDRDGTQVGGLTMGIRTKIVATLGPERSIHGPDDQPRAAQVTYMDMVPWLVEAGVDVFRLNMSHCSKDGERERRFLDAYRDTRSTWESRGRCVAILGDLQGPKIRIGDFFNDRDSSIELLPGATFVLHTRREVVGSETEGTVFYEAKPFAEMAELVRKGQQIWLGDGEAMLEIREVSRRDGSIICQVRSHGHIKGGRGVTVRGVTFPLESFTTKDRDDLKLLLSFGDDLTFIALSFVNTAEDILKVKYFIREEYLKQGLRPEDITVKMPGLVAKIETQAAVNNIDEILDVADGVMVARGDLGMQLGLREVARIQKSIIHKCNVRGKPVITATQMLDSMERNPIPTRAEVTDIYNAILDGTDAVMLSGETSKGPYPVQAVKAMCEIAEKAEQDFGEPEERFLRLLRESENSLPQILERVRQKIKAYGGRARNTQFYKDEYARVDRLLETQHTTDRVSHAACSLSIGGDVAAIMAPSTSGRTTRMVSRFRPTVPVVGAAHDYCVARKLSLCFGVHPVNILRNYSDNEAIFRAGCERAKAVVIGGRPLISAGDLVVITAGFPLYEPGTTNLVKLHPVA
jgi:pyruvate kinase